MEKTLATPLHFTDYRETSQIVVLYTRDYGKLSVLARGIKRFKKKSNNHPFEFLSFYQVRLNEGQELQYLAESQMVEFFPHLRNDLARLYSAYYLVELIRALTVEGDENPALFDLLLEFCKKLEKAQKIKPTILEFEYYVLQLTGFFPHLENCVLCSASLEHIFGFSAREGGSLCKKCHATYKHPVLMLNQNTVHSFLQIEEEPEIFELNTLRELRRLLQFYWIHILEKELKLFPYIAKMKTP